VPEHRGVGNETTIFKDGPQQKPVIDVADRTITGIGVGSQKQITLFDSAVIGFLKTVNKAAELTHDHFALEIGNHGEFVVLLADSR